MKKVTYPKDSWTPLKTSLEGQQRHEMPIKLTGKLKEIRERFDQNPSNLGPSHLRTLVFKGQDLKIDIGRKTKVNLGNCIVTITPELELETKYQNDFPTKSETPCPSCKGTMVLDFSYDLDSYIYICLECSYTEKVR